MITLVRSHNLKGADRAVDLGKLTLITGPNGSGKSAICNAITLALGGYVEDVAGRATVRDRSTIAGLGDGGRVWAEATDYDGAVYSYDSDGKPAPPATNKLVVPKIREALTGSDVKGQLFLVRAISEAAGVVTFDWLEAQLGSEASEILASIAKAGSSPTDALAQGKVAIKEKIKAAKADVDRAQGAIEGAEATRNAAREATRATITPAQMKQLEEAHAQAVKNRDAAEQLYTAATEAVALRDAVGSIKAIDEKIADLSEKAPTWLGPACKVALTIGELGFCAACGTAHPKGLDETWGGNLIDLTVEAQPIQAQLADLRARRAELERVAAKATVRYEAIYGAKSALDIGDWPTEPLDDYQAAWSEAGVAASTAAAALRDARAQAQAATATRAQVTETLDAEVRKAREALAQAQAFLDLLKRTSAAIDDTLAAAVTASLDGFNDAVTAILDGLGRGAFRLDVDPVRFGFVGPNGAVQYGLSGAEELCCLAAMAAVLGQSGDVAVLPEADIQPRTLRALMEGLSAYGGETQVILQSTARAEVDGWAIVSTASYADELAGDGGEPFDMPADQVERVERAIAQADRDVPPTRTMAPQTSPFAAALAHLRMVGGSAGVDDAVFRAAIKHDTGVKRLTDGRVDAFVAEGIKAGVFRWQGGRVAAVDPAEIVETDPADRGSVPAPFAGSAAAVGRATVGQEATLAGWWWAKDANGLPIPNPETGGPKFPDQTSAERAARAWDERTGRPAPMARLR